MREKQGLWIANILWTWKGIKATEVIEKNDSILGGL